MEKKPQFPGEGKRLDKQPDEVITVFKHGEADNFRFTGNDKPEIHGAYENSEKAKTVRHNIRVQLKNGSIDREEAMKLVSKAGFWANPMPGSPFEVWALQFDEPKNEPTMTEEELVRLLQSSPEDDDRQKS